MYVDETVPDKPGVGIPSQDGQPDNGVSIVGSGESFPVSGVSDGDYFLRTDFKPNRLFRKEGVRWVLNKTDNRGSWAAANRVLAGFINNDNIVTNSDGGTSSEKVNLSKVVKPKTDN